MELPTDKEDGRRKSESVSGGISGQTQRKAKTEENKETDPQIRVMEKFKGF